jgi:uncharacterized protein (UPF0264 family)
MDCLISVICEQEAVLSLKKEISILDIKNPSEGSLGASFPWVIEKIVSLRNEMNPNVVISATLGDWDFTPGAASLAARGLASCNVDYIKLGLYGIANQEQASIMLSSVVKSIKNVNDKIKVVAAGYADYKKTNGIDYETLINASRGLNVDSVMLDTAIKDGSTLFDYLQMNQIQDFVKKAHLSGLQVALAGALNLDSIHELFNMNNRPDVIGVRGVLCSDSDRTQCIDEKKLDDFIIHCDKLR